MNLPMFSGTGVALVTPFRNQAIDYEALGQIIEFVISGGVDYIVCLGTTGEAITLTAKECREVLDFTIEAVSGRKPIIAGFFGDNNTERLVNNLCNYDFTGVTAIMSSSPSYNKPTQEGIFQHYLAVAEASPLPLIIYNVPGRTSSNVTADTILRLADASDRFIAVKEASGDLVQTMRIIKEKPAHFNVLSGDDPLTLPLIACGAIGVISVIANAFPAQFSDMVRAALHNDFEEARRLNDMLLEIHPWLYVEGNPTGVKAAMELLGLCSREVRLPLVPMATETMIKLRQSMAHVPGLSMANH